MLFLDTLQQAAHSIKATLLWVVSTEAQTKSHVS